MRIKGFARMVIIPDAEKESKKTAHFQEYYKN